MYLTCHMTSHDYLIERACKLMGGNALCCVTMLISLANMSIVMLEIQCF